MHRDPLSKRVESLDEINSSRMATRDMTYFSNQKTLIPNPMNDLNPDEYLVAVACATRETNRTRAELLSVSSGYVPCMKLSGFKSSRNRWDDRFIRSLVDPT